MTLEQMGACYGKKKHCRTRDGFIWLTISTKGAALEDKVINLPVP